MRENARHTYMYVRSYACVRVVENANLQAVAQSSGTRYQYSRIVGIHSDTTDGVRGSDNSVPASPAMHNERLLPCHVHIRMYIMHNAYMYMAWQQAFVVHSRACRYIVYSYVYA